MNRSFTDILRLALIGLAAAILLGMPKMAFADPPGWTLVWNDEFHGPLGSPPNRNYWVPEVRGDAMEYYTADPANAFIAADPDATDGRALDIRVLKNGPSERFPYTAASLRTIGTDYFQYGRIEMRAKVPTGIGMRPAFWMLGQDYPLIKWPNCGEIDIMEIVGTDPTTVHGSLHGTGVNYSAKNPADNYTLTSQFTLPAGQKFTNTYHIFAVEWSPNLIKCYCDNVKYAAYTPANVPPGTTWPFNREPFFILLNTAVGGPWGGPPDSTTVFPQDFLIDYVRVYHATFRASVSISRTVLNRHTSAHEIVIPITLQNGPDADAATVMLTQATLAGIAANILPIYIGTIPAGKTTTLTLRFPAKAARSKQGILKLSGNYSGGSTISLQAVVPP